MAHITRRDIVRTFMGADLIGRGTVGSALYGLSFTLYCLCLQSSAVRLVDRSQKKKTITTLIHMTSVMAVGLLYLALDIRSLQMAYIDQACSQNGPLNYESAVIAWMPIGIADKALGTIIDTLIFGAQVRRWRCACCMNSTNFKL